MVKVAVVDLPLSWVQEVFSAFDIKSESIPNKVYEKYPKFREKTAALVGFLGKNKQNGMVYIYSTRDEAHEVVIFKHH